MSLIKYQAYFDNFARLSRHCAQAKAERAKNLHKKLEEYFSAFPPVFERWRKLGGNFNLFELAFRRPRETACTRILAWFLDAKAEHGQGNVFFKGFLELIESKYWSKGQPPLVPEDYSVETEVAVQGGRMDIVISDAFLIIVEAKIYSGEHDDQLKRYKQYAAGSGAENVALVFLTVGGEESTDVPKALPLTWKKVGMKFQQVLSSLDALPLRSPLRLACRDFCRYINNF